MEPAKTQNIHDIDLGVNYPVNFSVDIKREFGFELGYQYSRIFNNRITFSTGFRTNVYYIYSWKNATAIDSYFPLLIGYSWQKIAVYGGITSYITDIFTFSKFNSYDPDLNNNYPYYTSLGRKFGIGLNVCVNYNITQRWLVYTDFMALNIESFKIIKSNYGLLTVGVKFRLSKNNIG